MQTTSSLRLYVNPLKPLVLLIGASAFVAVGYLMLRDPHTPADAFKLAIAWVAIGFFGLGALLALALLFRYALLRRPLLEVDAQGWRYAPRLLFGTQIVNWRDISAVGVYRQRGARGASMYYLVVSAKDPETLPRRRLRFAVARAYPAVWGAAIVLMLNLVFLWPTPRRCERLLDRIRKQCDQELRLYGVQVEGRVREMSAAPADGAAGRRAT